MPTIRLPGPDGTLLARDNWVVAFFFPNPFPPVAAAARAAFELWRATAPGGALKWGLMGASAEEVKPVGPNTLARCAAMLDPAKAEKREITSFSVFGPNPDAPDHLFRIVGDRTQGTGFAEGLVGLVETWFPTEFGTAPTAEFARRLAELLPYQSGYAAPSLASGPGGDPYAAGGLLAGLAFRHPGYDVPRNDDTRFHLKGRVVGARWLTFLGPGLIEQTRRSGGNRRGRAWSGRRRGRARSRAEGRGRARDRGHEPPGRYTATASGSEGS